MTWISTLPLLLVLSSLIPGLIIFKLREDEDRPIRTGLNIFGALLKFVLIIIIVQRLTADDPPIETRIPLLPQFDLLLRADNLSILFVTLSAVLWLVTTLYAIGYLEDSPHRSRFFGFFSLCVSATMGIALAGNLFTFFIFYELLTLCTYPLVVHWGTDKALRGGGTYLIYTLTGGAVLLIAMIWLHLLAAPVATPLEFAQTGAVAELTQTHGDALRIIFFMFMAALGVKTAFVPIHGWLPRAMVAPAPVSALLHAVAVVKAGAFGVVRLVYDLYGVEVANTLNLLQPLLIVACITVIVGSVIALFQDDMKKRLAYSTVSQVSYIVLGVALFGPVGSIGGLIHLVHQGVMKITLFFGAGNFAKTFGVYKISKMDGIGRQMPWTMASFTVGALGMIGVPLTAGFISKWFLGAGALDAGQDWVVGVLVLSSLLNAGYFLPILYRGWFKPPQGEWKRKIACQDGWESHKLLVLPPVITAVFTLALGILANFPIGLLHWVEIIVNMEYMP